MEESLKVAQGIWLYGDSVRCVSLFGGCTYGSLFQVVQVYH